MLHHFVCWHVKCVEKVPFRKSGHIYVTRFYKTDPNHTLGQQNQLTPPVDSYTKMSFDPQHHSNYFRLVLRDVFSGWCVVNSNGSSWPL